jgi:hypothetical protein
MSVELFVYHVENGLLKPMALLSEFHCYATVDNRQVTTATVMQATKELLEAVFSTRSAATVTSLYNSKPFRFKFIKMKFSCCQRH